MVALRFHRFKTFSFSSSFFAFAKKKKQHSLVSVRVNVCHSCATLLNSKSVGEFQYIICSISRIHTHIVSVLWKHYKTYVQANDIHICWTTFTGYVHIWQLDTKYVCVYIFMYLPSMASPFALFVIQCFVQAQRVQYRYHTVVVNHECQALSVHSFAAVSSHSRPNDSSHLICIHCMLLLLMSLLMLLHHQNQDLIPFRQVDALDALHHC